MPYSNEAAFKEALVKQLREVGVMVTPIQTRTRVGIPDLLACSEGKQFWIECKIVHQNFGRKRVYQIPFRPGQQAWAMDFRKVMGQPVLCAVAFDNGTYIFPMKELYYNGWVEFDLFRPLPIGRTTLRVMETILFEESVKQKYPNGQPYSA